MGDIFFDYCLEKLSGAPLEQAAAAFAGLGLLLTAITSGEVSFARLPVMHGLQSAYTARSHCIYIYILHSHLLTACTSHLLLPAL